MRGKSKYKKHIVSPDEKYKNINVALFIAKLNKNGKKETAKNILYKAIELAGKAKNTEGILVFEAAIKAVSPQIEVRSKRVGGATYQVPIEVKPNRKITLAMRWLIDAAKNRGNKNMSESLAEQLVMSLDNTGAAIKKKEDIHKMAEANRAFAHYARF